jgi:thiol-disulfide isomerase/thioredoxin
VYTSRRPLLLVSAALCLTVAALLLIGVGLPDRADYTTFNVSESGVVAPEVGRLAPPIDGQNLAGEGVELAGQPTIINFWATWCAPCRAEMQALQSLYENTDDLRIVAVNLDEPEALVREWVRQNDLTYDIVIDSGGTIARRYAFRDPPSTFMLDADRRITSIIYGAVQTEDLRSLIPR